MMKVAIVTEALGEHVSGGILWIVEVLNSLVDKGHDCCCFVSHPPYRSDWLQTKFPIYPIDKMDSYDGVLIAAYSPVAEVVAKAKNAKDRFYAVHTNESLFCHNGKEWQDRAHESYKLPLKIFCTSTYLQILMETVFNRHVIGMLVPPGVDTTVFRPHPIMQEKDQVTIGILNRPGWVRGFDTAMLVAKMAQAHNPGKIKINVVNHTTDRHVMANQYAKMDIYLDMSRVAGSPTPVKEAMACGAIPICTKYGTTDFVLSDFNGYIVPVDDVNSTSNLITLLSDNFDKRISVATNAVETVRRFDWSIIADSLLFAIMEGEHRGDALLKERDWNIQR